jgi:DNA polymerase-3 subunit delta
MLYLFFGSDSFRSNEKLIELKNEFSKNSNDLNSIISFDKNNFNLDRIFQAVSSIGLFTTKNLVIIKNCIESPISSAVADNLIVFLKKTKIQDFDLIFYQTADIRKNNKILNFVKKSGQIFEFLPLAGANLVSWIQKKGQQNGIEIPNDAAQEIAFFCGPNLWQQNNEIKKLTDYKIGVNSKEPVSKEEIQMLIEPQMAVNIFDFIDSIACKNIRQSTDVLNQLIVAGLAPLYLYSMIVYQFRNLIRAKILLDQNQNQYQIQKILKLHPYVAQKTIRAAQNFSLEKLKKIYAKLLDAEIALKTTQTDEKLILDLLVLGLCG